MSSERSVPTVDLALGAAPGLTVFVTVVHALALAAVLASGLALWLRLCFAAALAVLCLRWVLVTGLRAAAGSVTRLVWYPDDECTLVERGGRILSGRVTAGVLVTPRLATVTVRVKRHRRAVPISAGATDPEGLRQLRVRLTVAPPGPAGSPIRRIRAWIAERFAARIPGSRTE